MTGVWAGTWELRFSALTLSLFSDNTAETLENIADNTALLRWSTVLELCITSVGIVVLAASRSASGSSPTGLHRANLARNHLPGQQD